MSSNFLIIVSDTGSNLHRFPNAQGFWGDYTGKEYSVYVVDEEGEKHGFYCGEIVYAAPAGSGAVPSPEELIEKHEPYGDRTGEEEWGHIK
ncbi:hypothetical protein EXE48_11900 [Halorubrum sp. ASP1]|jgi:hypothetical protein|uniref:hypothetical protein n=1 Tax=Halorubrum sp. ASP1 TaxID=2518114 RepID=UPI0010F64D7B|nr:hypothetical protein [Halorubrum sp. ASP1]TKX60669.1 hypothetical protein EXE48_11900 [Halorubrum sp. ASP1]